jgi:hypothetical protein
LTTTEVLDLKKEADRQKEKYKLFSRNMLVVVDNNLKKKADINILLNILKEIDVEDKQNKHFISYIYSNLGNLYIKKSKTRSIPKYRGSNSDYNNAITSFKKSIEYDMKNYAPYINLFELQLINNNSFDKDMEEQFINIFKDDKEKFIYYFMLKSFNNIAVNKELKKLSDNLLDLKILNYGKKRSHLEYTYDFRNIEGWIQNIKDSKIQKELKSTLYSFKVYFHKAYR